MSNLAYFEIPADDTGRARKFYHALLGWTIEPAKMPGIPADYFGVVTGKPDEKNPGMGGMLSMGGMYKRQMPGTPIIVYAMVEEIAKVAAKVEKLGGKKLGDIMEIPNVGKILLIRDPEGNALGLWEPGGMG